MQLMRIGANTDKAWDAIAVLIRALRDSSSGRTGGCVYEETRQVGLAFECAKRSQPPLVVCDAKDFTSLYPQFATAPDNGEIGALTLKPEDCLMASSFETAHRRLSELTDVMLSSYDNGELTVAFAIANKL